MKLASSQRPNINILNLKLLTKKSRKQASIKCIIVKMASEEQRPLQMNP